MNARSLGSLSCFAMITWLATPATASPIQYTAYVMGAPYIGGLTPISIDLEHGGSNEVGSPALAPILDGTLAYTNKSVSLDGSVYVDVYAIDPQDPTQDRGVGVTVPITGSVGGNLMVSNLQGGYSGTGVSAGTLDPMRTDLPAPLLDLLQHPERVSLSAFVTDGHISDLQTTLAIGPMVGPVAAPEPSVLAILFLGAWGVIRRRSHRSEA